MRAQVRGAGLTSLLLGGMEESKDDATTEEPSSKATVKKLSSISGFGAKKQKALCDAFPSVAKLYAATVEGIRSVRTGRGELGRPLAQSIKTALEEIQTSGRIQHRSTWAGTPRLQMWNKTTRKKLAGAACPTSDKVEDWLRRNTTYER